MTTKLVRFSWYTFHKDGRIWSNKRNKFLTTNTPKTGYTKVMLTDDTGRQESRELYNWIALAFLGSRPSGQAHRVIRHLDGDKSNCAASNLVYGSNKENAQDVVNAPTRQKRQKSGLKIDKPGSFLPRREPIAKGKRIPGLEDYISFDNGVIWSFKKGKLKQLRQTFYANRLKVGVTYPDGTLKVVSVPSLVTLAHFGYPCPEGMVICHWDDNPFNNCIENLRYDSYQGNAADRERNKRLRARDDYEDYIEMYAKIHEGIYRKSLI